ncbi:hypothetical protein phiOC_p330 [Ochrobactrum phage vB_OspM_OC]|nr:hypothetical protein phiOC_p330 [Ochrobactrum phage vB_OspM_OC]
MKKIKNIDLSLSVTVLGYYFSLHFIPFRWAKFDYRTAKDIPFANHDKFAFQLWAGPIHFWTSKFTKTLAVEFNVSQNVFHGNELIPRKKK